MTARQISYLLFALIVVAVIVLRLGPVLLAGLFAYMILDLTHRKLVEAVPDLVARWLSLLIFVLTAAGLSWIFGHFLKLTLARLPVILGQLLPLIDSMASSYAIELPFENLKELREVIIDTVKENARMITRASGVFTKGFFQVAVGIFVAVLCFFSGPPEAYRQNLFDSLRREFNERMRVFMGSFEKVFGAQVIIASINTVLTAIFLLVTGMPYAPFLILATFVFGVIPIVGNVISNTIIVGTALTLSLKLAVFAMAFLVIIHKGEYFLNSMIIGGRIMTPMWVTLLGLLIGEIVLGVPGMILAPTMIHFLREELIALPAKSH